MDTPHTPPSSPHALLATLAIALLGVIGAVVMSFPPSPAPAQGAAHAMPACEHVVVTAAVSGARR